MKKRYLKIMALLMAATVTANSFTLPAFAAGEDASTPDAIVTVEREQSGTETTVTTGDGSEGDISLDLIEGSETLDDISGTSGTAGETVTGDLKEDDSEVYDQTTVTTTDRTATAEVGEITVTTGSPESSEEEATAGDGYNYYWSDIYTTDGKSIIDGEAPSGYWTTGKVKAVIIKADGTETEVFREGVCQRVVGHDNNTPEDLSDDYEIGGLYCVDCTTGIQQGLKYRKANLEDADYYTQDEANHLRAILTYGYTWDDDDDKGYTNLENMKAMLRDAKENGDEEIKALLADLDIDNLTREQAATATGMAIWQYGNRYELEEGERVEFRTRDMSAANAARVETVYKYLCTLTKEADEEETQVINEEKFIDDMSMIVGGMVKDHVNNQDDDDTNDAYSVDLKFSLVVSHVGVNDDLVVKVVDNEGNVVKAARIAGTQKDGEDFGFAEMVTDENNNTYYVLKGLELIENSNATFNLKLEGIQMLEDGVYIFESQDLSDEEYVQQWFTYYKAHGVFEKFVKECGSEEALAKAILAESKSRKSQNFIGYFGGEAEIDVNMAFNMTFNVEEATITTEHTWSDPLLEDTEEGGGENDPSYSTPVINVSTSHTSTGSTGSDSLTEIEEEEVPMADAPNTGNAAAFMLSLAAVSGLGLAGVAISDKKRTK